MTVRSFPTGLIAGVSILALAVPLGIYAIRKASNIVGRTLFGRTTASGEDYAEDGFAGGRDSFASRRRD